MSKSYRIRTTPGEGNGYLKVNVDLNQNYDHLEILSLKLSQIDEYQNYCSEYGVIAGRVEINDGFGVPNVKVSIFIPVDSVDLNNSVISSLYPYQTPFPDEKNGNGIRYNLLPKNKQTLDHTPVGTFPNKREILDDSTMLEIYEKYYKYTTTTNESGDYILFGVPVGDHLLHYDCDLSDIGFISSRPYEMMSQGYSKELFQNRFKFKSSNNLGTLSQIISQNVPVNVEPFWCDSLSVGSPLGINRYDISIPYEVTPTAIFMGSIFSDDEKDSVNKNCKPDRQMGKMDEVITGSGEIEAIRRNVDGAVETFKFKADSVDENGNWSVLIPMNIRKVVTDEFGNLVPSPDGIKGIATEGDYRFRISMDATDTDKKKRTRAKFLVPNTNNNFSFGEYSKGEVKDTPIFTINEQLSTITDDTPYSADTSNQYNYLEEFFPFRWKKVYTVKQYIGRFQKTSGDEARGFIGIKDIIHSEGVNRYPTNRIDTNTNILYGIICMLMTLFGLIVAVINGIIMIINGLVTMLCQLKLPVGLCVEVNVNSCSSCAKKLKCRAPNCLSCSSKKAVGCCATGDNCKHSWPDSSTSGNATYPSYGYMRNGWNNTVSCGDAPGTLGTSVNYMTAAGCQAMFGTDWDTLDTDISGDQYETSSCPTSCAAGVKIKIGSVCICIDISIKIKYQCLIAGSLCTKCKSACPEGDDHSCCLNGRDYGCSDNVAICGSLPDCCCDCCVNVPMIPLKCSDEEREWKISTLIPSPFAPFICNKTYVVPFSCVNCGGLQTPGIKDWVSCVLEPLAVWLKMMKFDAYNDWVGGSLYFPLVKRKYKLKKRKKKFGQLKKDKFCDFDCRVKNTLEYQGDPYFYQWRIKISQQNDDITYQGCNANTKGKRVTGWYGTVENDDETFNLNLAVKDLSFPGTNSGGDGCNIVFESYDDFTALFNNQGINFNIKDHKIYTEHGKPEYIEVDDGNGNTSWENIGGHDHYRNVCNNTRLIERKEYFKTSLDCTGQVTDDEALGSGFSIGIGAPDNEYVEEPNDLTGCDDPPECREDCTPSCSSNGVAPCKRTSSDNSIIDNYNKKIIKHGLITFNDEVIYYTPRVLDDGDSRFNDDEYKGNLLLPTTIMELGSSVYCDIDDIPFIMDQLVPTTFNLSVEDTKYVSYVDGTHTEDGITGELRKFKKYDDRKNSSLNLRAYVEFGCFSVVCANTMATVNQSQIGVEMIEKNDIGVEIGNCFVRFDHDEDIRGYFCRRFNGFKGDSTFHHNRPGSIQFDNDYQTYPEITLTNGNPLFYELPETYDIVKEEYNDGDPFIPGDACGYTAPGKNPDYFYGLAPGQTASFINYPNSDITGGANGTINFGITAHADGIDETNDTNNGFSTINGVRFNRSQTPYHLYFGLVPGKTSLHKTVAKFFADKIDSVTLRGVGDGASQNTNNSPNLNKSESNPFTVYKTCLGETLIETNVVN